MNARLLRSVHKDMRPILAAAGRQKFKVERTAGGHIRVTAPNGQRTVTASTPSDYRSIANSKAELARLGVCFGGETKKKRKQK